MDNYVNIKYLFREAIRKWWVLAATGALVAALMIFGYVREIDVQVQNMQYGSMSIIKVDGQVDGLPSENILIVQDDASKEPPAEYMVLSDEVIYSIVKKLRTEKDANQIRTMLQFQTDTTGAITKLYAISPNQEEANELCSLITPEAVDYIKSCGYQAKTLQTATDMGPVSVSKSEDKNDPEHEYTVINKIGVPALATSSIIKKFIVGFVVGAFLSYAIVCLLYLLRGKVAYADEVSENGMLLLGEVKKGQQKKDYITAACNLALETNGSGYGDEKVALVKYGNNESLEYLEKACKDVNIKTMVIKDLVENPQEKINLKDVSGVVYVVKRNTVRIDSLKREVEMINNTGKKMLGVIFLD